MNVKALLLTAAFAGIAVSSHAADARILYAYTQRAADINGGASNLESKVNSALSTCNSIHLKTHQNVNYIKWLKVGWYKTSGLSDQRSGSAILNDLSNNVGGATTKARSVSANLIALAADTTDVGGIAWQPGQYSVTDAQWPDWQIYSHEIGHNYNAAHEHGLCWTCNGTAYRTIMQHNYCSGTTIQYYSNPNVNVNCRNIGDSSHNNAQRMRDIRWTRSNTYF